MAATTVDTLLVRIESDLSDVRRDLRRLQTDTRKTTQNVSQNLSKIGGVFTAVLGSVVVAQVGRGTIALTNFASDIEEMQAMSEAVFGRFVHQVRSDLTNFAEAVGRSSFELEKMAATVQDTFVPLGFARGEASELSVMLTKLAVDVASFKNEAEGDVMNAFTSALIGNHEAVKRFGIAINEGTLRQELFRMGITKAAADVDMLTKVQARLNLILAGTVDAQGDALETSESYANLVRAMDAQFKELSAELGNTFLPRMKEVVKTITEATKDFRAFLKLIGLTEDSINSMDLAEAQAELATLQAKVKAYEKVQANTTIEVKGYTRAIEELAPRIVALQAHIAKLTAAQNDNNESQTKGDEVTKDVIKAREQAAKTINKLQVENEVLAATLGQVGESEIENIKITDKYSQAQEHQIKKIKALTKDQIHLKKAVDKFTETQNLAKSAVEEFTPETEKLNETLLALNEIMKTTSTEEMPSVQRAIDGIRDKIRDLDPAFSALRGAVQTMSQGISEAFADALISGKLSMDSLKDVFANFVRTLLAKAIELMVINRILNNIFNLQGSQALPTAASGGSIPARATGGPVLVGERGPELFIPHSAGVIRNNHDTMNMLGGGKPPVVVNQTLNINTGVSDTVRSELLQLMPRIQAETVRAVTDSKRRGTGIAKVFA